MENKDQHEQYEEWSLLQLKNELRQRKAKLSGRKKELVARWKFLDANVNMIVTEDEPAEEYFMPKPVKELYKDLHSDIPDVASLEMSHAKEYLQQFNKTIDEKCKALYHERFIRFIQVAKHGGCTYVAAVVWAEMRKATSYNVDIAIDKDDVVVEAQCECGAGQGPTADCKHVAAVLFGFVSFRHDGTLITELTCTQVLQTFHRAKPLKGSPMKAEHPSMVRQNMQPVIFEGSHRSCKSWEIIK